MSSTVNDNPYYEKVDYPYFNALCSSDDASFVREHVKFIEPFFARRDDSNIDFGPARNASD
jgi:hypothetical protein